MFFIFSSFETNFLVTGYYFSQNHVTIRKHYFTDEKDRLDDGLESPQLGEIVAQQLANVCMSIDGI